MSSIAGSQGGMRGSLDSIYPGKAFAHFHNDHELDIRPTRAVIERARRSSSRP